MPWQALIDLIEFHDPIVSMKGGLPLDPLASMPWIHLLQQCNLFSDPAMKEALIKVSLMGGFSVIELFTGRLPDAMLILIFRHLLEK